MARDELAVAAVDLFLPRDRRLTDQQRAIMAGLLDKLVDDIELEVRRCLLDVLARTGAGRPELEAALADESLRVASAILRDRRSLDDAALIALLLQRTEEHLIAVATAGGELVAPTSGGVVESLARNPDAELARRAVAYVVAQARRRDRLQEPLLPRDELPADLAYRLHWQVAAVLRQYVLRNHPIQPPALDDAMEEAVRLAMADHAEGQGFPRRAWRLAGRLGELGDLDDALLAQALKQGHAALFAAGLSVRAEIGLDAVWRAITDRGRHSLLVLLRAVGMDRAHAAEAVAALDEAQPLSRSPAAARSLLEAYDRIDRAGARRVLRFWQLDVGYREAIDEFDPS